MKKTEKELAEQYEKIKKRNRDKYHNDPKHRANVLGKAKHRYRAMKEAYLKQKANENA